MTKIFEDLSESAINMKRILKSLHDRTLSQEKRTGITCKSGCGACCQRPHDVWATVAEMLPMAMDIFDRGDLDKFLERLDNVKFNEMCIVFKQDPVVRSNGRCSEYQNRPITCILFGASFLPIKDERFEFLGCRWLRETYRQKIDSAIDSNDPMKLNSKAVMQSIRSQYFDPRLAEELPINTALRRALELIGWASELKQRSEATPYQHSTEIEQSNPDALI